ncbi:hypothetical protein J3R30DRAFT_3403102 [Lentinula aciculospora]|uniref:Cyclohexanone monooxygenase n=1 Tax=Lentinula aciculospora TaxID=153920 RepID=A0A9W9AIC6_9AGAR|nr:hypothetical protein J3R30DRAFT_3403102 [Lentinula aciculospora]
MSEIEEYDVLVIGACWLFGGTPTSEHPQARADGEEDGQVFRGQFLSLCTGIGSKYHIPKFKGFDSFQGEMHHTARWPKDYDYKGKRVGFIGTGATGVPVIQEIAPLVAHLTVFQRTPNLTLPMRQRILSPEEEEEEKLKEDLYTVSFKRRYQTFTGLNFDINPKLTLDATPEERALALEGFHWCELFL